MPWKEASIMSQRLEFLALATQADANVAQLARRFGISRPTAYKWIARNRHKLGICKVPERIAAHNQHGHAAFFEMP